MIGLALFHLAMLVSFIAFPEQASIAILVGYGIATASPLTYSSLYGWGAFLALTYLCYRATTPYAIAMTSGIMAYDFVVVILIQQDEPIIIAGLIPAYLCAFLLGRTANLTEELQNRRIQWQRLNLASQLHESIANELSTISLLTQHALQSESDPTNILHGIEEISQKALRDTHAFITLLSEAEKNDNPSENLYDLCLRQDRSLAHLGHSGNTIVSPLASTVASETINGIVREIYANIARHSSGSYGMSIVIENGYLVINERNAVDVTAIGSGSGSGIALMQRQVEHLGGHMSASEERTQWNIIIMLPIMACIAPDTRKTENTMDRERIRSSLRPRIRHILARLMEYRRKKSRQEP